MKKSIWQQIRSGIEFAVGGLCALLVWFVFCVILTAIVWVPALIILWAL